MLGVFIFRSQIRTHHFLSTPVHRQSNSFSRRKQVSKRFFLPRSFRFGVKFSRGSRPIQPRNYPSSAESRSCNKCSAYHHHRTCRQSTTSPIFLSTLRRSGTRRDHAAVLPSLQQHRDNAFLRSRRRQFQWRFLIFLFKKLYQEIQSCCSS
jgi:hypothetical protein